MIIPGSIGIPAMAVINLFFNYEYENMERSFLHGKVGMRGDVGCVVMHSLA